MAHHSKLSIGWVGLGAMGFGMATNLVKQGHDITAFDVFAEARKRFEAAGGTAAASLKESAAGKALYVCMVASAVQLNQLMFDGDQPLIESLQQGTTFLVASTVAAADIILLEERLKSRGRQDIFLVDCPVSGGARRAADGTLSIMAGGSKLALAKANQLLVEMSATDKLFFPGGIGQGSNLKMVHQVLACIHIATNSEALAFASYLDLDLEEVREAVLANGSRAYSWMFENRSLRTIENKRSPPESALTIILKDTGIITKTARHQEYPVPLCSAAEQVYLSGLLHGFGPEDDATLARIYRPSLEPPPQRPVKSMGAPKEKQEALLMVQHLMTGIHTVAVAEAVGFAHSLGLEPEMVMNLVNEAAGASWAFKEHASGMFSELKASDKDDTSTEPLRPLHILLADAVSRARNLNCPLFMGNAALQVMTQVERVHRDDEEEISVLDLVSYYK